MRLTRSNDGWLVLLSMALLLPMLAMPLGQDHATFFLGGSKMLDGGLLYADFIDVKPPLVYLLFGAGGKLLGSTPLAIRVFDLLWQGATIALMVFYLRRQRVNKMWLWCSVILYALLYATLGHAPSAQPESLFVLPLLGILILVDVMPSWGRDVLIGVLCGIVFLLKYPLAIVGPLCVAIFLMRGEPVKKVLVYTLRIVFGSILFILAVTWPIITNPRFPEAFAQIVSYLSVYGADPSWSMGLVTMALKNTAVYLGDKVSIMLCALFVIGALASQRRTIVVSLMVAIAMAISIAVERKFHGYHFARLYLPISIVGGLGLSLGWQHLKRILADGSLQTRVVIGTCVLLLLCFSPLPRYANIVKTSVATLGNPRAYDAYLTSIGEPVLDYLSMRKLEAYLQQHISPESKLLLVSMSANPIAPFLPTKQLGPFADAHFIHGVGVTPVWMQRAAEQLSASDWVVIDFDDPCTTNMHPYTSWQAIENNSEYRTILNNSFECVDTVACYYIFKHR